jgi:hypothetical protein
MTPAQSEIPAPSHWYGGRPSDSRSVFRNCDVAAGHRSPMLCPTMTSGRDGSERSSARTSRLPCSRHRGWRGRRCGSSGPRRSTAVISQPDRSTRPMTSCQTTESSRSPRMKRINRWRRPPAGGTAWHVASCRSPSPAGARVRSRCPCSREFPIPELPMISNAKVVVARCAQCAGGDRLLVAGRWIEDDRDVTCRLRQPAGVGDRVGQISGQEHLRHLREPPAVVVAGESPHDVVAIGRPVRGAGPERRRRDARRSCGLIRVSRPPPSHLDLSPHRSPATAAPPAHSSETATSHGSSSHPPPCDHRDGPAQQPYRHQRGHHRACGRNLRPHHLSQAESYLRSPFSAWDSPPINSAYEQ